MANPSLIEAALTELLPVFFCVKSGMQVCSSYLFFGQKVWCTYGYIWSDTCFDCVKWPTVKNKPPWFDYLIYDNIHTCTCQKPPWYEYFMYDNIRTCICWLDRCRCHVRKSAAVSCDSRRRWLRDSSTASVSQMWWVSNIDLIMVISYIY